MRYVFQRENEKREFAVHFLGEVFELTVRDNGQDRVERFADPATLLVRERVLFEEWARDGWRLTAPD